jgi:hypothetical protein
MRNSLTIVAVAVAAITLWSLPRASGSAHEPGSLGGAELHFAPAPGWTQAASAGMSPPAQPQSAIAANVPIMDPPGVAHADETVQALPATGIVITASISVPEPSNGASFPERSLPLSLTDADVRHSFEGQPNPGVPEYLLWQRVNGFVLDVRVFFGSQDPSAAALSDAQAELERLIVPPRGG